MGMHQHSIASDDLLGVSMLAHTTYSLTDSPILIHICENATCCMREISG
jgi:hypothetical protein